jgi:ankyrin repeat protein
MSSADRVLYNAARDGRTDQVRSLLAGGLADPSQYHSSGLRAAAAAGHTLVVEALLEDGRANPSALDSAALVHAALKGHLRIVQLLLEDGRADPSAILRNMSSFVPLVNARALIAGGMRWLRRRPWLSAA